MYEKWTHYTYDSPLGRMCIQDDGIGIARIDWESAGKPPKGEPEEIPRIKEAHRQLCEYFAGERKTFELVLRPRGTAFQKKVWNALKKIPYGEIRSYGEVAEMIDNPKGARAVGMANNRNPIPIMIPCHRVVSSTGKLAGYAADIEIKKALLEIEGVEIK